MKTLMSIAFWGFGVCKKISTFDRIERGVARIICLHRQRARISSRPAMVECPQRKYLVLASEYYLEVCLPVFEEQAFTR